VLQQNNILGTERKFNPLWSLNGIAFVILLIINIIRIVFISDLDDWVCLPCTLWLIIAARSFPELFSIQYSSIFGFFSLSYCAIIVAPIGIIGMYQNIHGSETAFLASVLSLGLACIGATFIGSKQIYNKSLHEYQITSELNSKINIPIWINYNVNILCCMILITTFVICIFHSDTFVFSSLFFGDTSEANIRELRDSALDNSGNSFYRYLVDFSRNVCAPYACAILFIKLIKSRSFMSFFIYGVIAIASIFILTFNGEKSKLFLWLICSGLSTCLFFQPGRNKFYTAFISIIILASAPLIIIYTRLAMVSGYSFRESLMLGLDNIVRRIFYVPARTAMIHFDIFPSQVNFLNGSSISGFDHIVGKDHFQLANFIYVNFGPPELNLYPDPNGLANAAFVSEIWANFGWAGVVIASIFLGIILQSIDKYIKKFPVSLNQIALFSTAVTSSTALLSVNITTVLVSGGFALIVFLNFLSHLRKSTVS
jgi:hypothetical protein